MDEEIGYLLRKSKEFQIVIIIQEIVEVDLELLIKLKKYLIIYKVFFKL